MTIPQLPPPLPMSAYVKAPVTAVPVTPFKAHRVSLTEFLMTPIMAPSPIVATAGEPFPGAADTLRLAMHQSLCEGIARINRTHITGSDHRIPTLITELTETLAMAQALHSHLKEMDS
jgi:hypothetical protein